MAVSQSQSIDADAFSEEIEAIDGKIYLKPGMVYVAPQGIFVNFDGQMLPVQSLCVDSVGVYIFAESLPMNTNNSWRCPKCKHKNNGDRSFCANCNYFRG